jgi:hypothetical protein
MIDTFFCHGNGMSKLAWAHPTRNDERNHRTEDRAKNELNHSWIVNEFAKESQQAVFRPRLTLAASWVHPIPVCLFVPTIRVWSGLKFAISTEILFFSNSAKSLDRHAFCQY